MSNIGANDIKAGYRAVGLLLFAGFGSIGLTRLEDRAILGPPGGAANAMAVMGANEAVNDGFDGPADDFVGINQISRAPANRLRRILRDRDAPSAASRQILGVPPISEPGVAGAPPDAGFLAAAVAPSAPGVASLPLLASLPVPLLGSGTPIFAANFGGGNGGGGGPGPGSPPGPGGNGGNNGPGGNGGEPPSGTPTPSPPGVPPAVTPPVAPPTGTPTGSPPGVPPVVTPPVAPPTGTPTPSPPGGPPGVTPPVVPPSGPIPPIPEPGTWMLLILGIFAVGTALRRRSRRAWGFTKLVA